MGYHLVVKDEDGKEYAIEQGKGLGIREHDDVMLSWGLSKKTWVEKTIPAGQTLVIKVTVPAETDLHHAESRILETKDAPVRFKILSNANPAQFPAVTPTLMPVVNQIEDHVVPNLTIFEDFGTVLNANAPSSGNLQANFPIWAVEGQGSRPAVSGHAESVKGRYSSPGVKAVLIINEGTVPTRVYYQYDYHEK